MNLPIKVLKKRFSLTKEEVQANIRLLPFHKLYLEAQEEIERIKKDKSLTTPMKLRDINNIRRQLRVERKKYEV